VSFTFIMIQTHARRKGSTIYARSSNGAIDEGDEQARGPKLDHHMPMFYVTLGDFGRIAIEYWVLPAPDQGNKRPIAAFVDPMKPVVLTFNGQNQAEMTARIVRKEVELPYLSQRLICHVDCNSLTRESLRLLFASGREEARAGQVYDMIEAEVVRALKSDDRLAELNREARDSRRQDEDESAKESMRKEVARLLHVQGFEIRQATGGSPNEAGGRGSVTSGPGRRSQPQPVDLREPPTFIRILAPEDQSLEMHPEQRRYIRLETDAHGHYHNAASPDESPLTVVVSGTGFRRSGSTPLQNGRMRIIIDCDREANIGAVGELLVELRRPGLPTLSDHRSLLVIEPPPVEDRSQRIVLPPFDVKPVDGPDDPMWSTLNWPDGVGEVASSAVNDAGRLIVYYSTVFPRYNQLRSQLERKDPSLARSFTSRYEIWLAVHSLILEEDQRRLEADARDSRESEDDDAAERRERCRMAIMSAMFASREIQQPAVSFDE
jgi:hypothetical protein